MLDTRAYRNAPGVTRAVRRALEMLRPPPDLPPSEWAEANVRIPAGNAIPGEYRIANAPYQREPMNQMVNPDCTRVTLMWGAQLGKTLTALCVQGYAIDMRPRSQMMMQPSQHDAQTWLETKFNPLVEASPGIARKLAKPRGREGVNNQRMKSYFGGFLMMSWAGSPNTMRGRSAPLIVCDEVDGYGATEEGHPVGLLWQRSATFGDERFLLEISTPTLKDASYIEAAFLAGDQRRFYVECPHCAERQFLKWENVTWVGRKSTGLADAEADLEHDDHEPDGALYACEACGHGWNDGERATACRNAEAAGAGWKAAKPFRGHASYHCWEAYSLLRRLGDIVRDYLDKLKTGDLQTFANVSLSQTWEEPGQKVDPTGLMARAKYFTASVPMGGLYLTAGIDMQIDRLEVEIVAWGVGEESWSVEYRVLWGDPLAGDVWNELDDMLAESYVHESGMLMPISAACLDTGGTSGYTQCAYEYLRGKTGRRLFGIKGLSGWGRPIVEKMMRKQSGRSARKIDLFGVGVDQAKLVVQRHLAVEKEGPGYCHIPADRPDLEEWCKQITAEKLTVHYVKGAPVRTWSKPDRVRNEAGDCRVYALSALKIMQPSMRRLAERLQQYIAARVGQPAVTAPLAVTLAEPPESAPPAEIPPEEKKPGKKQNPHIHRSPAARRANWVNGWKK